MIKKFVNNINSAEIYDKLPGYSKKGIKYVVDNYFEDDYVIADIGSGTGKLVRDLLQYNIYVYAIEPDKDMKSVSDKIFGNNKRYFSINSDCYNTGLKSNSVDYIFVAQALHLFDIPKFKIECNRILKNKKNIVIIWNRYDFKEVVLKEMLAALYLSYPKCELRYDRLNFDESFVMERKENIESCSLLYDGTYSVKTFENKIDMSLIDFLDFACSFEMFPLHNLKNIDILIKDGTINLLLYKNKMREIFNKYKNKNKNILTIPIITDFIFKS